MELVKVRTNRSVGEQTGEGWNGQRLEIRMDK
jgi:hypothetical protein